MQRFHDALNRLIIHHERINKIFRQKRCNLFKADNNPDFAP